MNNFDDLFAAKPAENNSNKDFTSFDKEEWAARKQQERADAYALIDETAEQMSGNGELFQAYLDVQSRFDRYSVGNALLITAQMPEATRLADFKTWKDNDLYIKKGESGITILEPGDEYTREDGSVGVSYNCVSYMLCKRNGVAVDNFRFDRLPESFGSMDAQELRGKLSEIRDVVNDISADMARVLELQRSNKSRDDGAR